MTEGDRSIATNFGQDRTCGHLRADPEAAARPDWPAYAGRCGNRQPSALPLWRGRTQNPWRCLRISASDRSNARYCTLCRRLPAQEVSRRHFLEVEPEAV